MYIFAHANQHSSVCVWLCCVCELACVHYTCMHMRMHINCGMQCTCERDREERQYPPGYSLGSVHSSEPCYCSSARVESLPPAGDIIWRHLALQSSCTGEETQEGEFFWKRTKVREKQKHRKQREGAAGFLRRGRNGMFGGDATGKLSWLTRLANLGQSRPSSPFSKRGFLSSFKPFEIPFTFPFYISQNSEPLEKFSRI